MLGLDNTRHNEMLFAIDRIYSRPFTQQQLVGVDPAWMGIEHRHDLFVLGVKEMLTPDLLRHIQPVGLIALKAKYALQNPPSSCRFPIKALMEYEY